MRGKTQTVSTKTPKATPLNFNPLLWRLFDKAAIPMPVAEAYEYHKIEREEQERSDDLDAAIKAEFEWFMEWHMEGRQIALEMEKMREIVAALPPLVKIEPEIEPCHYCGDTRPLDTSYSDEGHGWPFCAGCGAV